MTSKQKPALHICANEFCGREFYPSNPLIKTCSKECAKLYKNRQQARRYREGAGRSEKMVIGSKTICAECGKEFVRQKNRETVCSEECRTERTRRLQREWKARAGQTIVCGWCKQEFVREKYETYCCEECREAAVAEKMVKTKQARAGQKYSAAPASAKPKKPKLTGKALMQAQGVLITGKTDLQIAEEARAAGMSAGRYRAMLQMKYEKEKGIGLYAN